jgi:hypothetical protein
LRPPAATAGSPSLENPRVRRLDVIVKVLLTSTRLGIDHAISPMSRFSRLCDTLPDSVRRPPSHLASTSLAPGSSSSVS